MEKSMSTAGYMYQGKIFTTGPSMVDKKKQNVSLGNLHFNLPGAKELVQSTKEGKHIQNSVSFITIIIIFFTIFYRHRYVNHHHDTEL